jgi:hypothetical protein
MKVDIEIEYAGKAVVLDAIEVEDDATNQDIVEDFLGNYSVTITNSDTGEEIT